MPNLEIVQSKRWQDKYIHAGNKVKNLRTGSRPIKLYLGIADVPLDRPGIVPQDVKFLEVRKHLVPQDQVVPALDGRQTRVPMLLIHLVSIMLGCWKKILAHETTSVAKREGSL